MDSITGHNNTQLSTVLAFVQLTWQVDNGWFSPVLTILSWNLLLGQCIQRVGGKGVGWVVEKAQTKKKEDTNGRVQSSCDVYMHPQRTNISLQGLDRCAVIMGAISIPTAKLEPSFGAISPVMGLHGRQKALRKSRPVNIRQWGQ